MINDAVLNIVKNIDYENIGSYSFLKGHRDENKIVSVEREEFIDNYICYRIKGHRLEDMA